MRLDEGIQPFEVAGEARVVAGDRGPDRGTTGRCVLPAVRRYRTRVPRTHELRAALRPGAR